MEDCRAKVSLGGRTLLGEEVLPGVTLFRAVSDQRLVGFAIMGLRRRSSRPGWLTIPLESTLPEVTLDELEAEWRAMPAQRRERFALEFRNCVPGI
jgi:hypothetical protein